VLRGYVTGESMTWCNGKNGELKVLRHVSIDPIGGFDLPVYDPSQELEVGIVRRRNPKSIILIMAV